MGPSAGQALGHLDLLVHLVLRVLEVVACFITQYFKITFMYSTTDLVREVFKHWKAFGL